VPSTVNAAEVTTIGQTRTFYEALARCCDTDVQHIELALADLAALGLDEATLDGFQSAQEDARRAAGRCRSTIAVLDARQALLEEAVNATPGAAKTEFYQDGAATGRPAGSETAMAPTTPTGAAADPAADGSPERERVRTDRRAKADVLIPVSQLLAVAQNITEILDAGDEDDDPEDLLRNLLKAVYQATGEVGLSEVATPGTRTTFDAEQHHLLGDPPPDHDGRVQVLHPGRQWNHAGEHLVISTAMVVPYDDEHGAYMLGTPASLDEEGSGERIWLDEDRGAVPDCYRGPDWYTVEAVGDCDGTDEECPNQGGTCEGAWIYLYDNDPGESEAIHYASDAPLLMDYNT